MLGRWKIKLLDLFCGVGGASAGYVKAGFEVTGIDLKHGKRYPFNYIRGNVLALVLTLYSNLM
jgi:DNA (cytosine-5)-methyltransferase 1